MRASTRSRLWPALLLGASSLLAVGCGGGCGAGNGAGPGASSAPTVAPPTLRLFVVSDAAGALEPCGCQKDMLGGLSPAAAAIRASAREAPTGLLAVGPTFFQEPKLPERGAEQQRWKAEAFAAALAELGFWGLVPGENDYADGAPALEKLMTTAGGTLLGASVPVAHRSVLRTVAEVRVGLAAVSVAAAAAPGAEPAGERLSAALKELESGGAQLRVALLAMPRGDALRVLERQPGFQLAVVGKPALAGDQNDGPTAPIYVGETLVVQAPNHLQGMVRLDLYLDGKNFKLADGSGIAAAAERARLERRIQELQERLAAATGVSPADRATAEVQVARLRAELGKLHFVAPTTGSRVVHSLVEVRAQLGTDAAVTARLGAYYKRVNEHNRVAFADRVPPPVPSGAPSYVGGARCANCHVEEQSVWKGTRHAGAYATLTKGHKEFNLDCVGCHVTGYEQPGGTTVTHVEGLTNIQCEQCHGPGSQHLANPMDKTTIRRNPPDGFCAQTCHHPPHVAVGWDERAARKAIIAPGHGLPALSQPRK